MNKVFVELAEIEEEQSEKSDGEINYAGKAKKTKDRILEKRHKKG